MLGRSEWTLDGIRQRLDLATGASSAGHHQYEILLVEF